MSTPSSSTRSRLPILSLPLPSPETISLKHLHRSALSPNLVHKADTLPIARPRPLLLAHLEARPASRRRRVVRVLEPQGVARRESRARSGGVRIWRERARVEDVPLVERLVREPV